MGYFFAACLVLVSLVTLGVTGEGSCKLSYNATELSVLLDNVDYISVTACKTDLYAHFLSEDTDRLTISPDHFNFSVADNILNLTVTGKSPGHVTVNVTYNSTPDYLHITVLQSFEMEIFSEAIGWIYFVAWSLSFYPQLYINYKRKSVVGLNFDFLLLNVIGFFLYSLYNCSLFWNSYVKDLYLSEHPGGLLPILVNDIVFSLHALLLCIITIIQCFIYEREGQTVSILGKGLSGIYAAFILITLICTAANASEWLTWLRFLEFCSYVKLSITIIKYMPQAYMNFKRKSTEGWSIGNVLLDFTGGVLSMGQMIVNAWNYDDWSSIFGDPTKFGLGLFSVLFDVLFIVQHYILYRHGSGLDVAGSVVNSRTELVTKSHMSIPDGSSNGDLSSLSTKSKL